MALSITEWAKRQGFSRQYAHRLVQSGVIPRQSDGLIDEDEANAILATRREPTRPQNRTGFATGAPPSSTERSLNQIWLKTRIKNEMTRGEILQLEVKEKKRERVPLAEINTLLARIATVTRDNLLNLPDRIQHELAAQPDAAGVHTVLSEALREALVAVSDESIEALKQELAQPTSASTPVQDSASSSTATTPNNAIKKQQADNHESVTEK